MLVPRSKGIVPPGGQCRYTDPDTGWRYAHPYYENVSESARSYRLAAGLPIPDDWDAFFDEQFCKATPQGCVEVPQVTPGAGKMAVTFAKSMLQWALSGFKVTTEEQFQARQDQCAGNSAKKIPRCQYFGSWSSFGFARCTKCGCFRLKLFLPESRCPIGKWGPV